MSSGFEERRSRSPRRSAYARYDNFLHSDSSLTIDIVFHPYQLAQNGKRFIPQRTMTDEMVSEDSAIGVPEFQSTEATVYVMIMEILGVRFL